MMGVDGLEAGACAVFCCGAWAWSGRLNKPAARISKNVSSVRSFILVLLHPSSCGLHLLAQARFGNHTKPLQASDNVVEEPHNRRFHPTHPRRSFARSRGLRMTP